MSLLSSLQGTVTFTLTGADLPGTLDQLTRMGMGILGCRFLSDLEAVITIRRADWGMTEEICRKRGDILRPDKRKGVYWPLASLKRRPVLILGMLLYLAAALYLPGRVLFVRVVGNSDVPSQLILERAEECGIEFGASRREIRSEKMKNKLLEALPELQWAGVNTYGCVAEISVRERSREDSSPEQPGVGHVVAGMDGIILTATATRGNLMVVPGQAVLAGEILISGFSDLGLCIRTEQAQGEIFAATRRKLTLLTSSVSRSTGYTGGEMRKFSLLIGKKRINLWKDSGFWDTTCDRMYEENYITLPGGFRLPWGWSVERYRFRQMHDLDADSEMLKELLTTAGEGYLKEQMISGTIRDALCSFEEQEGVIQMTGEYSCVEMIGFTQRLEIGEMNGEDY